MEPTDLTCPSCGSAWKVIKAPDGPIACPNCKAVVGQATAGAVAPQPAPAIVTALPPDRPPAAVSDIDDPGVGVPARGKVPDLAPPRRGRNPLLTVAVVVLIVLLVPVALSVCLFAVCTASFG